MYIFLLGGKQRLFSPIIWISIDILIMAIDLDSEQTISLCVYAEKLAQPFHSLCRQPFCLS